MIKNGERIGESAIVSKDVISGTDIADSEEYLSFISIPSIRGDVDKQLLQALKVNSNMRVKMPRCVWHTNLTVSKGLKSKYMEGPVIGGKNGNLYFNRVIVTNRSIYNGKLTSIIKNPKCKEHIDDLVNYFLSKMNYRCRVRLCKHEWNNKGSLLDDVFNEKSGYYVENGGSPGRRYNHKNMSTYIKLVWTTLASGNKLVRVEVNRTCCRDLPDAEYDLNCNCYWSVLKEWRNIYCGLTCKRSYLSVKNNTVLDYFNTHKYILVLYITRNILVYKPGLDSNNLVVCIKIAGEHPLIYTVNLTRVGIKMVEPKISKLGTLLNKEEVIPRIFKYLCNSFRRSKGKSKPTKLGILSRNPVIFIS